MNISNQPNKFSVKKKVIFVIIFGLAVVSLSVAYLYFSGFWNTPKSTLDSNTNNTSQSTKIGNSGVDQPIVPAVNNSSNKQSVSMEITSAINTGSVFRIRTVVYIATDLGTCTLNLSKAGSQTITKSVSVQPMSSTSTCRGFDIPIGEMSNGQWNVSIKFENDNYYANASQVVDLQGL